MQNVKTYSQDPKIMWNMRKNCEQNCDLLSLFLKYEFHASTIFRIKIISVLLYSPKRNANHKKLHRVLHFFKSAETKGR